MVCLAHGGRRCEACAPATWWSRFSRRRARGGRAARSPPPPGTACHQTSLWTRPPRCASSEFLPLSLRMVGALKATWPAAHGYLRVAQSPRLADGDTLWTAAVHHACLAVGRVRRSPPSALGMLEQFVELHPGDVVVQNGGTSAVGQVRRRRRPLVMPALLHDAAVGASRVQTSRPPAPRGRGSRQQPGSPPTPLLQRCGNAPPPFALALCVQLVTQLARVKGLKTVSVIRERCAQGTGPGAQLPSERPAASNTRRRVEQKEPLEGCPERRRGGRPSLPACVGDVAGPTCSRRWRG